MAQAKKGSVVPFYAVAAIWVGYAALFDLYAPVHFLTAAVLSLAAFLLLRALCAPGTAPQPAAQPKAEAKKPTGNPDLDKMIADGDKAVRPNRPSGGDFPPNLRCGEGGPEKAPPDPPLYGLLPAHHLKAPQRLRPHGQRWGGR